MPQSIFESKRFWLMIFLMLSTYFVVCLLHQRWEDQQSESDAKSAQPYTPADRKFMHMDEQWDERMDEQIAAIAASH